jgi:hypothetical protein
VKIIVALYLEGVIVEIVEFVIVYHILDTVWHFHLFLSSVLVQKNLSDFEVVVVLMELYEL